jgi:hypothetical protein
VLVVILPMALHTLIAYGPWRSAKVGAMVLALLLSASLMVDKYFYGKWTLALWNLFKYNANSKHGPELYASMFSHHSHQILSYHFWCTVMESSPHRITSRIWR